MIETFKGKFIDPEALTEWLNESLKGLVPDDTHISIIPRPWEAQGESRFFCEIDVNNEVTVSQLLSLVVKEHSRGNLIHFYANDVVEAAVTSGELSGTHFYLYYQW